MMASCESGAFRISPHAVIRMAQRGIRRASLDLVLLHGSPAKAHQSCEVYIHSQRSARQLASTGYDDQTIAAATRVRAIVAADGTVVTCYYQRTVRSEPSGRQTKLRDAKFNEYSYRPQMDFQLGVVPANGATALVRPLNDKELA